MLSSDCHNSPNSSYIQYLANLTTEAVNTVESMMGFRSAAEGEISLLDAEDDIWMAEMLRIFEEVGSSDPTLAHQYFTGIRAAGIKYSKYPGKS